MSQYDIVGGWHVVPDCPVYEHVQKLVLRAVRLRID